MGSLRNQAGAQQALHERIEWLRELERRLADRDATPILLGAVRELLMEAEAEIESNR
jgi:hypothetical protein